MRISTRELDSGYTAYRKVIDSGASFIVLVGGQEVTHRVDTVDESLDYVDAVILTESGRPLIEDGNVVYERIFGKVLIIIQGS